MHGFFFHQFNACLEIDDRILFGRFAIALSAELIDFCAIFEWIWFDDWIHANALQIIAAIGAVVCKDGMSNGLQAQIQIASGEYINFCIWHIDRVYVVRQQRCLMHIFWSECYLCATAA